VTGFTADQLCIWNQHNIKTIKLAAKIFPFERSIALGPSYYYLLNPDIHNEEALKIIKNGIKIDPYAVDLLNVEVLYEANLKDLEAANKTLNRLCNITPSAYICKFQKKT
jgi:hypothetical protein